MVARHFALALVAGFISATAAAQSGNAMLDKATATPAATSPPLSPELRGDIYMARRMYREAIEAYGLAPSTDAVVRNKTGIAYHQLNELESARKAYQQALKIKPDYSEAMNNMGAIYYARKSYRRSISWYEKALKQDAKSARAASYYMNLGTAWFARKNADKGMENYQIAVKLDPEVLEHHGSFGQVLEERSIAERASYHFSIARLYAREGRSELALQYLRKALEEGYKDKKALAKEPDFAALRDLPEFKELLTLEPRVL
jgi:tetratricopeptide (TPR) repeat protein